MTHIKKEWLSHLRQHRFLILGVIVLFFSLSDPVMLYFTPLILESQVGSSVDLSSLFEVSQRISIQNFMGDLYQIFGIVTIIFTTNILINEYKKHKIVMPYAIGLKTDHLIFTKYLVYTFLVNAMILLGSIFVHYYSGFIFEDYTSPLQSTLFSALGLMIFLNYNIALVFLIGAFKQSKVLINTCVLINYLALPSFFGLFKFIRISPYRSLEATNMISSQNLILSMILTVIITIVAIALSAMKLKTYPSQ